MMMGAVVKHYWAKKKGLMPEDVCLVSDDEAAIGVLKQSISKAR